MRIRYTLQTLTLLLLALLCFNLPLFAQTGKVGTSIDWATVLQKGKEKRTSGIVCMSIGAALITTCALLPTPEPKPGQLVFASVSSEQAITGVGGFIFTTVGLINLLSGISKVHRAKVGLGKMSYYLHPRQNIQGTPLSLRWQIGK